MKSSLPIVALFGRTNVGKSTLFNCLRERKQALVSHIHGTTRDSNVGEVSWNYTDFLLVDTAGIADRKYLNKKITGRDLDSQVQKQALGYFQKADLVVFVVDGRDGLLQADRELANFLLKNPIYQKKTILTVNKIDGRSWRSNAAIFNKLGLGEPLSVSAATGSGTGDLLDTIVEKLTGHKSPIKSGVKKTKAEYRNEAADKNIKTSRFSKKQNKAIQNNENGEDNDEEDNEDKSTDLNTESLAPKVCIIGQPNVGKSSLLNALLGYEKAIVSNIPHTTREPQDSELIYEGKEITIIDTAGISRHGHKEESLEKYGIEKSLAALKKADIALLVLDISQTLPHQDAKIVEEIFARRKSLIIIANKWDLIKDHDVKKWTLEINRLLPFAVWAPILFVSALSKNKINSIFPLILQIAKQRKTKISNSVLNKFLKKIITKHKPPKGKYLKTPHIYELTQSYTNPPHFMIRIGANDTLGYSYVRFIENQLRNKFNLTATPVAIEIKKGLPKDRDNARGINSSQNNTKNTESEEGSKDPKKRKNNNKSFNKRPTHR
jgi:GTP-binding protein